MAKEHRGGKSLAGFTVLAILLAGTVGYVSAFSRMFQAPVMPEESQSGFLADETSDARSAATVTSPNFQQYLGRTFAAWLVNSLPGYSSGRARELWYLSLDRSGDRQLNLEQFAGSSNTAADGYSVFSRSAISGLAPVSGFSRSSGSSSLIAPLPDGPLAVNTTNTYSGSTTGSVLTGTNWGLGHVPIVSEDAVFNNGTGVRTFNNGSLTVGSWNVTAAGTYTLRNGTSATTSTLTLGGAGDLGNGVSGTTTDLLFATGGTFTITGTNGTAILNVVLGQSGNFNAAATINVNAVISDGGNNFGITKTGVGTLTLSGANTYGGGLTMSAGTLNINSNAAPGTGTLTINGGTIQNTSGGAVTLTNNNTQVWGGDFSFNGSSGTSNLDMGNGAITLTGNRAFTNISGNTSSLTIGGAIGDGGMGFILSRLGTGTGNLILTGNSTYGGGTILGAGTTIVSSLGNFGASGNLGTGNISLGNGTTTATLVYTGAGESTSKAFNLNGTTGGAIIDTTGATGGLILTSDVTATGAGTKTLTLRGDSTGNIISGAIFDNSSTNKTNVTKAGTGTWTLTGGSPYTGTTTVSGGTLAIDNNNSTTPRLAGTSGITVNSGGTLLLVQGVTGASTNRINDAATMTLAGGTFNTGGLSEHGANNNSAGIGPLTLVSSSIIDLGNGASILAFANSSAATWTGTLSIYNWSGSPLGQGTDQVYFGSDTTGLTMAQLGQISFYSDSGTTFLGVGSWAIDSDGEVVPTAVPEPSTWGAAALAFLVVGYMQRKRVRQMRQKAVMAAAK